MSSRIPGFFKLSMDDRLEIVRKVCGLSDDDVLRLREGVDLDLLNKMVENVIGKFELPLGIATNFIVNGRELLIPMVTEEPSVIAAASNAAKVARAKGGFFAQSSDPVMIGQIQIVGARDGSVERIVEMKDEILELANSKDELLVKLGGGAKDLELRIVNSRMGRMIVVHLLIDCRDAMGANAVNTMCEAAAPLLEKITGGKAVLRIVSNLADRRIARARATFSKDEIGEDAVDGILLAHALAESDPYRACTHNKGIMNGIVAVAIATGNDTRALEAGAHAYACRSGRYKPLTMWTKDPDGNLVGEIELPIAAGTVGGATSHPAAAVCRKILGVKSARDLAEVMASVGLAQNFAALRALAMEGIQKGHMKLHAKNIAISVGARGSMVDEIAKRMVEEGNISMQRARELLEQSKSV